MDTTHKKLKVGRERGGHLSTTISYPSKNLISLPSHRTGVKLFEIRDFISEVRRSRGQ